MVNLFDEFFSANLRWFQRAGRFLVVYLAAMLLAGFVAPLAHADRVKDLASLASMRANQLLGYGLVVGLEGTGDGADLSVTASSMKAMLTRLGVNVEGSLGDF
ncbi:MAG: flagellar basal body P-ring protein FlgI, partial [Burkholderiaceae bacterium]